MDNTIQEYMSNWEYRRTNYARYIPVLFYAALGMTAAGLVMLSFDSIVVAVVLLATAAFFVQGCFHNLLMVDIMKEHSYLAKFIADQRETDLSKNQAK